MCSNIVFLQVSAMGPLIDAELERTDRRHAQLTRLSHELVMLNSALIFPSILFLVSQMHMI